MRCLSSYLILVAALAAARPAAAAWTRDASTNQPVSVHPAQSSDPGIVSDGQGGVYIAWHDVRNGEYDIYAQHFDARGIPSWPVNGVAVCTAPGSQIYPMIVTDGAGGAIVTWFDLRTGARTVYAQRLNAAGSAQWALNGVAVCSVSSNKDYLVAVADGAGGMIAAWSDTRVDGSIFDIYMQRVNAAGAPVWPAGGIPVSAGANNETHPRLAPNGSGGAYVCWNSQTLLSGVQHVSAAGALVWGAAGIILPGYAAYPRVTTDASGGAIVAWWYQAASGGCSNDGFRAQRFLADGTGAWGPVGAQLTSANCSNIIQLNNDHVEIAPDGAGGVISISSDLRNNPGHRDLFAQRIDAAGMRKWPIGGVPVCTAAGDQQGWHPIVSDGAGGAYMAWHDLRSGQVETYLQRVNASGAMQWTANGVLLSGAPGIQAGPRLAEDGRQGLVVAWHDLRTVVDWDLYAQRIDAYGYFGDVTPEITSVKDVPADQGGRVRIRWNASYRDTLPTLGIGAYGIWRQVTESAARTRLAGGARLALGPAVEGSPAGLLRSVVTGTQTTWWEGVGMIPARGEPWYTFAADTFEDSTIAGNPLTTFMVDAHDGSAPAFWSSIPAAGYSVDNLPPAIPQGFVAAVQAGATHLDWTANVESDLAAYAVYRGTTADFVPSPATRIATPTSSEHVDPGPTGGFYKLSAVDIHGNESGHATLAGTVDVDEARPLVWALEPPRPSPATRATAFRLSLAEAGPASLTIYDAAGRRVRRLLAGVQGAGEHVVPWDLRDEGGVAVPGGLYFARLDAGGFVLTRRIVAAR